MSLKGKLKKENIIFLKAKNKTDALNEMIEIISKSPHITDKKKLKTSIFEREELMSTGIGFGLGIPHVKINSVSDLEIAIGLAKKKITDYESLDNKPVEIIIMIAANTNQHSSYISCLAEISKIIKNNNIRNKIFSATDTKKIYKLLTDNE